MRRSRRRAFTLIEVMVVVAISGLMAALAVANYQPAVASIRLHGTVRAVESLLRRARIEAMATRSRVQATTTASSVTLQKCRARFGAAGCATSTALTNIPGAAVNLGDGDTSGLTLTTTGTTLVFGPSGIPEGSGSRTYLLSHPAVSIAKLVVVTPAGDVRVQ